MLRETIRQDYRLTWTGTNTVVHREFLKDWTTSSAVNLPMTSARLRLSVVRTGLRSIRATYSVARVPRFTCTKNFVFIIFSRLEISAEKESLRVREEVTLVRATGCQPRVNQVSR